MSNVVPAHTKLSPLGFATQGDFQLVNNLLKNPRYEIPEHLRKKVIASAEGALDNHDASDATKLAASRVILEADKRNLDVIKLIVPKQHVHREVKDLPTEELEAVVIEAYNRLERDSR